LAIGNHVGYLACVRCAGSGSLEDHVLLNVGVVEHLFCCYNNTSLLVEVANPKGKYEALEKYGIDLTEIVKQGKLDPIIGHDEEIRHCIQILF